MTVKYQFQLIFLILVFGCSDKSDDRINQTQFGFYIENGPRQGFQYIDSNNRQYNYRYYTMTITNDTIIPIHLEINFSGTEKFLCDSCKSKVFLLPRHLTPERQHFDKNMSIELKRFLDVEIGRPVYLNKTLKYTETCVLTFGVLTETRYSDSDPTTPYGTELLTLNENSAAIALKLKINDTLMIPCGQIYYIKK